MPEHPNAVLVREALESFKDDPEGMLEMLADDVEWWEVGATEPLRGKQAVVDSIAQFEGIDEMEATVHDVVANDDHTVALVSVEARRGDRAFHYRTAEILHIRDGKVTERWSFANDTQAVLDFFAGR